MSTHVYQCVELRLIRYMISYSFYYIVEQGRIELPQLSQVLFIDFTYTIQSYLGL